MSKHQDKIKTYQWDGIQNTGLVTKGIIDAHTIIAAKAELRKQGIVTRKIVRKRSLLTIRKKIQNRDIALFSRQLSTLMNAGISLIQAFDIISKGHDKKEMRLLIDALKHDVESGLTYAEALRKHPSIFDVLFCNLVDIGEKSGTICVILNNIATYKEKMESIKKKMRKIMTYPLAVLVVTFLIITGLLVVVIPQFESLFNQFGAELPTYTQAVVRLSRLFQTDWYLILGVLIGLFQVFVMSKRRSALFAKYVDIGLLRLPIIGNILMNTTMARFSRTLAITFAAGLPLTEALQCVSRATGNQVYAEATNHIRQRVSEGISMQLAMKSTNLFPNMAIQFVAIGEESGTLEYMLNKTADYYDEDVNNAIDAFSSLLEPAIMAILGLLVGSFVVAIYLPIFNLGEAL